MSDLELMELAIRRELSHQLHERIQDQSAINVLDGLVKQIARIHKDRAEARPKAQG